MNIKTTIRKNYNIDIDKINIIKLYKITDINIDNESLSKLIDTRHKKWQQAVNTGTNESFIERDKAYLAQAQNFETILRNKKLRKELFKYYNNTNNVKISDIVEQYFKFVSSTNNHVSKKEIDFFFNYFPEERKNKKSIEKYLKINIDSSTTTNKKEKQTSLVTNLFDEDTLLNIRQCDLLYQSIKNNKIIIQHFPFMKDSFYKSCGFINEKENIQIIKDFTKKMRTESFSIRNEFGSELIPIVDMYNILTEILENKDVTDNFEEFKLLLKYPILTPYMFAINEIKKENLNELYDIAKNNYKFFNINEFMSGYFNKIYDNFGIYDKNIKKIIQKAENQSTFQKLQKNVNEKIELYTHSLSTNTTFVFILTYYPIIITSFIFKLIKYIIEHLRYINAPAGAFISILLISNSEKLYKYENPIIYIFKNGFGKFTESIMKTNLSNASSNFKFLDSLFAILFAFIIYILPGIITGFILWNISGRMYAAIDFKGINRSFDNMVNNAKFYIIQQDELESGTLIKNNIGTIITNIVITITIITIIIIL